MALVEFDLVPHLSDPPVTSTPHRRIRPGDLAPSDDPTPPCIPAYRGLLRPASRAGRVFGRALEMAPGLITWLLVTSPIWAGLLLPRPFALMVLAFDLFWLYLSTSTALRAFAGYRRLRAAERIDWHKRLRAAARRGEAFADWDEIVHAVVIPNYKEPVAILRRTLASLAAQENADRIFVVLAMEAREQGAGGRAQALETEFGGCFAGIFSTFHPAGLPGEVVGKSSNENWAARIARRLLVDELGYDLGKITITSCDADTVFHPRYFACLTYKFATDRRRYRRFWQSPILLTNNIWETPAPLRVGSALAGVHILANLTKRDRVVFPQSTYSLSLRMADDVGYWDTDIIPEDWHMFLKCFFTFSGEVEVEAIFLPTGNDAVRAATTWRSFVEAFQQHKRHAWGASDIPYAVREMLAHREMAWKRRIRRVVALTSNHLLWTTHWFLLSIGWWAPWLIGRVAGVSVDVTGLHLAARIVLTVCFIPYAGLIVIDARLRPPRPSSWTKRQSLVDGLIWIAIPVTSLIFSTAPALVAQTRLMLGRRLEYRVTEKS